MCLLTDGKIDVKFSSGNSDVKRHKENICSLARCLGITLETNQVIGEARKKLRVKRPEELMDGSIFPPISNQEANIVNNNYDSDHEEDEVPIISEMSDSDICTPSEVISGGKRCNDSGIAIEYCLEIEQQELELKGQQEDGSDIPPPPENILLDNQESLEEGEITDTDGEEVRDKTTFCDYLREQNNKLKSTEKSFDKARSKNNSDKLGVKVAKVHREREELRLRWQKKDVIQDVAIEKQGDRIETYIGNRKGVPDGGNLQPKKKKKRGRKRKQKNQMNEKAPKCSIYVCSECPGNGRLGPDVYLGPAFFASLKQLTDHLKGTHSMRIRRDWYTFKNRVATYEYETEVEVSASKTSDNIINLS